MGVGVLWLASLAVSRAERPPRQTTENDRLSYSAIFD